MSNTKAVVPQIAPYPLRMPVELRDMLQQAAEMNTRSLNAEIVHRLKYSTGMQYPSVSDAKDL